MDLVLSFSDKYQLMHQLRRANSDRLFVANDERLGLGRSVRVELRVDGFSLPIVIEAKVVGRRPSSRRFAAGAYVRVSNDELERCRRLLAFRADGQIEELSRQTRRLPQALPVQLSDPKNGVVNGITEDLSCGGMRITTDTGFSESPSLDVNLELPSESISVGTSVAWRSSKENAAGLRIDRIEPQSAEALRRHLADAERDQRRRMSDAPGSILLVDDDPEILEILSLTLNRHGYHIARAVDGEEAMLIIRRDRPRLVLLDVLMPRLDGAFVCRWMRADAELVDTPIILLSALDQEILGQIADDAGATDFLAKPLNLSELLDLVGSYLK